MKFKEIFKKVIEANKRFKYLGIPINLDLKIDDLHDALIEANYKIEKLKNERDALRNENAYLRRYCRNHGLKLQTLEEYEEQRGIL